MQKVFGKTNWKKKNAIAVKYVLGIHLDPPKLNVLDIIRLHRLCDQLACDTAHYVCSAEFLDVLPGSANAK